MISYHSATDLFGVQMVVFAGTALLGTLKLLTTQRVFFVSVAESNLNFICNFIWKAHRTECLFLTLIAKK